MRFKLSRDNKVQELRQSSNIFSKILDAAKSTRGRIITAATFASILATSPVVAQAEEANVTSVVDPVPIEQVIETEQAQDELTQAINEINNNQAVVEETPVVEQTAPVVEETPVVEQTAPVVEETPAVEQTAPVVEETPVVEQTAPVVEETPAVEQTAPVVEETQTVEQTTPAVEETQTVEQTAPVVEETKHQANDWTWFVDETGAVNVVGNVSEADFETTLNDWVVSTFGEGKEVKVWNLTEAGSYDLDGNVTLNVDETGNYSIQGTDVNQVNQETKQETEQNVVYKEDYEYEKHINVDVDDYLVFKNADGSYDLVLGGVGLSNNQIQDLISKLEVDGMVNAGADHNIHLISDYADTVFDLSKSGNGDVLFVHNEDGSYSLYSHEEITNLLDGKDAQLKQNYEDSINPDKEPGLKPIHDDINPDEPLVPGDKPVEPTPEPTPQPTPEPTPEPMPEPTPEMPQEPTPGVAAIPKTGDDNANLAAGLLAGAGLTTIAAGSLLRKKREDDQDELEENKDLDTIYKPEIVNGIQADDELEAAALNWANERDEWKAQTNKKANHRRK